MATSLNKNLRELLREQLPQLLPNSPDNAIKGTELINLLRRNIDEHHYTDATLRYHFSILSQDPTSPIAKVPNKQGYYLRKSVAELLESHPTTSNNLLFSTPGENTAHSLRQINANKFTAILQRLNAQEKRIYCPLHTSENSASWLIPDALTIHWADDIIEEDSQSLNPSLLRRRQLLGLPLFELTACCQTLELTSSNLRYHFFKTLSTTAWCTHRTLHIATSVHDEALTSELARLAATHNVQITTHGIPPNIFDQMLSDTEIINLDERSFEALSNQLHPTTLHHTIARTPTDYSHLHKIATETPIITRLFDHLERCIHDRTLHHFHP